MSVFRLVFLGTPDFAAEPLKRIFKDPHFKVELVVSQPDRASGRHMKVQPSPVKAVALEHGIPVLTPESVNTPEVLEQIRSVHADAAVVIAFGQILKPEFLEIFPRRCVNLHGSLLPRWRGAAPIQRALEAGDQESGVALQVMVSKLDAGPVLGVRRVTLTSDLYAEDLYTRLRDLGSELLEVEFCDYLRGNLTPREQEESQVTIAKKIRKEEGEIRWNRKAQEIACQIRGLSMWPGTWSFRQSKMVKIKKAQARESSVGAKPPGTVVALGKSISIACGEGLLEITQVQPESRAAMSAEELIRGYHLEIGEIWGN